MTEQYEALRRALAQATADRYDAEAALIRVRARERAARDAVERFERDGEAERRRHAEVGPARDGRGEGRGEEGHDG